MIPRKPRRHLPVPLRPSRQQPESHRLRSLIDSSDTLAGPALRTADEDPLLPPDLLPGDAIALPPTDLTPNDGPGDPPTRIPHLGHAVLFLSLTGLLLLLTNAAILGLHHPAAATTAARAAQQLAVHPKLIIAAEALTYLGAVAISFFLFPLLWRRPFFTGIAWNAPAPRRNYLRLIPIGVVLSLTVQAASSFVQVPKSIPLDDFFRNASDVWLITIFGTLVAPAFEEICFRGFLFPAFAIAYDWLSLPRTPAAREAWNSSNTLTTPALIFSGVFTSIAFALLHAQQIGFAWPVVLLLFTVSLALTYVRWRLRSVAASTLVHASYNFTIFFMAFVATGGYRHLDRMPH